jgi:hypothetical protein
MRGIPGRIKGACKEGFLSKKVNTKDTFNSEEG